MTLPYKADSVLSTSSSLVTLFDRLHIIRIEKFTVLNDSPHIP